MGQAGGSREKRGELGTAPIGKLLLKFAVPSIISMLVNALYNIVDQIFIGQDVGYLGNAATTVAFPLTTLSTAVALLIGIGTASNFNLRMGEKRQEEATRVLGNGITLLVAAGLVLMVAEFLLLEPLVWAFGATQDVYPYAIDYAGIIIFGLPFAIFSTASSHLLRADGSPTYSMVCVLSGAGLNVFLDWLFVFGFGWGIKGAAWATVIGQVVSFALVIAYMLRGFKTVRLLRSHLILRWNIVQRILALGLGSFFNHVAMFLVQITMNNVLTKYGAASIYGENIPLACVGVISRINVVYMSVVIGISQGSQPIIGFNYGAGNYSRVKSTYLRAALAASIVSVMAFACFQLFPRPLVSIFGTGSELYFQFAERYMRIFMLLTFLNGVQPLTGGFFTSIGKAMRGMLVSMTRQILFLLPLVLLLPRFMGIDGVLYAGPIADGAAFALAAVLLVVEMRDMDRRRAEKAVAEKGGPRQ